MQKLVYLLFLIYSIAAQQVNAQPDLDVRPHTIEFEDEFFRFEKVYLINEGDQVLRIDSLTYKYNNYFIRFDSYYTYPFFISPGDTVPMDCILSNYFTVTQADTTDTLFVYHNGVNGVTDAKIKIDFFDNNYREAGISGQVTSGGAPLSNASVHFLYDGNYILKSVTTDANGNYYAVLPAGYYTAAAERDSHYVTFSNGSTDPFGADIFRLRADSMHTLNFDLQPSGNTGISVSGSVDDSLSGAPLRKGLVIVRKGTHTPGKPSSGRLETDVYTSIIDYRGNYTVSGIAVPDYYYVQAFSQFYVPGYFTSGNAAPVFWQQADSVYIGGPAQNMNFSLQRDSSVGAGSVSGTISAGLMDNPPGNTVVYAQSADYNGQFFNHAIPYGSGQYSIKWLPYGNYNLRAQIIGYPDVVSPLITIDPLNTSLSNINLAFQPTRAPESGAKLPGNFILHNNYPNPFNPATTISFEINAGVSGTLPVKLLIYDQLGRQTAVLVNSELGSGRYEYLFDAAGLSSGIYYAALISGSTTKYQKLVLLK